MHLDYTKVIILILWWRNFQLEYWRTFQLVSTEFYNRLSEVMETEDDLAVGDMVAFTNDYGVVFGPQEVLAFRKPWNGDRCVYLDSDAYWFPDRPDQLTLLSKKGAE